MQGQVLLSTTVQLYKLLFAMGSVFLMKDLDKQLENIDVNRCPAADRCAYQFFQGFLEVRSSAFAANAVLRGKMLRLTLLAGVLRGACSCLACYSRSDQLFAPH